MKKEILILKTILSYFIPTDINECGSSPCVYGILVLIMLTATLVLVMMATLEPIVKQVFLINAMMAWNQCETGISLMLY